MAIALTTDSVSMAQREGKTKFSIGPEIGLATSNPLSEISGNKARGL